ncbi:hypothetical protein J8L70_13730 [Pseudoalteromonas sp. MMG010]|uniref:hypothetical protein n=1 Tax=Pseudoalteromonas sp. MMG010 TaxID=2822685 RepID=UPI001B3A1664|nr:hypothetical protein [Pseudoalteromonas sp. MMG010]MBQ4834308.1 hypothetical protein [Pseudoalteromonas sp. MMG010]
MKLVKIAVMSLSVLVLTACGSESFYQGSYVDLKKGDKKLTLTDSTIKLEKRDKVKLESDIVINDIIEPADRFSPGGMRVTFTEKEKTHNIAFSFLSEDIVLIDGTMMVRENIDTDDLTDYAEQYYGEYTFNDDNKSMKVTFDSKQLKVIAKKGNKEHEEVFTYLQAYPVEIQNKQMILLANGKKGIIGKFQYDKECISIKDVTLTKI